MRFGSPTSAINNNENSTQREKEKYVTSRAITVLLGRRTSRCRNHRWRRHGVTTCAQA